MLITRISSITGIKHTIDLPITEEQVIDYGRGRKIQDVMFNLTPAQREFFLTGITEEEWEKFVEVSEDDGEHDLEEN